jgi:hypothetical protein
MSNKNVINLKYNELPKTVQSIIPKIHKIIMNKIKEISADGKYKALKEEKDFDYNGLIKAISSHEHNDVPVGVITKKNNSTFEAMIQITGHVSNANKNASEKLFHTLMTEVYKELKPQLKNDLDVDLSNDDFKEHGYEGFDVYTTSDIAKSIWGYHHNINESFDISPFKKFNDVVLFEHFSFQEGLNVNDLLDKMKNIWNKFINLILRGLNMISKKFSNNDKDSCIVESMLTVKEMTECCQILVPIKNNKNISAAELYKVEKKLNRSEPVKIVVSLPDIKYLEIELTGLRTADSMVVDARRHGHMEGMLWDQWRHYVSKLSNIITKFITDVNAINNVVNFTEGKIDASKYKFPLPTRNNLNKEEASKCKHHFVYGGGSMWCLNCGWFQQPDGKITKTVSGKKGEFLESVDPTYNVDMTEVQAKKTLRTLSQSLINDYNNESKKKEMSQYTANIYANIITKNLLPSWAKGFNRVKITLDSYKSPTTFEFIPPTMGQDFVSRFINGRESLNGHLHKSPEIRIKMSPRIFHTMKNPDDAYNFFKAAIKYYDSQVEKYGNKLMVEVMKTGHNMKHLIANSKLSGLVTYPLSLLFVFDDVDMSNKDTFKLNNEDFQSVNKFIKNISSRYAAPEKEKKQIVEDVKKMVEALRESCEMTDTIRDLYHLPESVEKLLFGGYENMIMEASRSFIIEQTNREISSNQSLQYIRESFGVKKLKKIPKDLIPYIQIETEAIKDANDKMILSSYTLGKIEIVEWYIELLTVGSKKYIVPHTKPYLELVRTQLLACFKKIMDTSIAKNDSTINIKYPPGYEG